MDYKRKLLDPRWQKRRLEVLNRDDWTCQLCSDKNTTLHIHHFCYSANGNPWETNLEDLASYCKHCHAIMEAEKWTSNHPYKVIKLEIIKDIFSLAVFSLGSKGVVTIYSYMEKSDKLEFSTCQPFDFISSIHNHFVTTNILLHG